MEEPDFFLIIMSSILTLLFRLFSTFVSYRHSTITKISKDDRLINSSTKSCINNNILSNSVLVKMLTLNLSQVIELRFSPKFKGLLNYPMVSVPNLKKLHPGKQKSVKANVIVWKLTAFMLFNYINSIHSFFWSM